MCFIYFFAYRRVSLLELFVIHVVFMILIIDCFRKITNLEQLSFFLLNKLRVTGKCLCKQSDFAVTLYCLSFCKDKKRLH